MNKTRKSNIKERIRYAKKKDIPWLIRADTQRYGKARSKPSTWENTINNRRAGFNGKYSKSVVRVLEVNNKRAFIEYTRLPRGWYLYTLAGDSKLEIKLFPLINACMHKSIS